MFAGDTPSMRSDATTIPAVSTTIAAITTFRSRAYVIAPSIIAFASANVIEGDGSFEAGAGAGCGAAPNASVGANSTKAENAKRCTEGFRAMVAPFS